MEDNTEGDNSQVEMKTSSNVDEEAEGNGVGVRINYTSTRKSIAQKLGRTPKNLCFLAATILLIFIIGECGRLSGPSWELSSDLFVFLLALRLLDRLPGSQEEPGRVLRAHDAQFRRLSSCRGQRDPRHGVERSQEDSLSESLCGQL